MNNKLIKSISSCVLAAMLLSTGAAALLSGCSQKAAVTPGGANYTNSNEDSTDSDNSSSVTESTTESTTSEVTSEPDPAPKERFIYGETEIPNIVTEESHESDGRAIQHGFTDISGTLGSMVFETHTFGDYTIRLVGDDVRADNEHFPGVIYAARLYIEAEKNGEKIPLYSPNTDNDLTYEMPYTYPYSGQFSFEYIILEDRIGNYLDMYDMKFPVIAMRYFNYTDIDEPLRKIVNFVWIENNGLHQTVFGEFKDNTGVIVQICPITFDRYGQFAVFSADEFKIAGENTLIDETAGIKYTIYSEPQPNNGYAGYALFTAERIE